jgi:glutathione S-transferase
MANAVAITINGQLDGREFLVADRFTLADIALYGYMHVAEEAAVDLTPLEAVNAWLYRVRATPGHIDDLSPYPANARPGNGQSIWDAFEM